MKHTKSGDENVEDAENPRKCNDVSNDDTLKEDLIGEDEITSSTAESSVRITCYTKFLRGFNIDERLDFNEIDPQRPSHHDLNRCQTDIQLKQGNVRDWKPHKQEKGYSKDSHICGR
ncbi:hypothetical protein DPMN_042222 [Dreissena polymorpha]|uniref:Uncharacterized protein n=1 Tax=Dreissena polymorpha TaxID=45954 RepID=A0A9D4D064_DREPO|nr:hypothetical protein DPMN_042222 [Dreissena polymorpha]